MSKEQQNQIESLSVALTGIFMIIINKEKDAEEKIEIIKGVYEIMGITEETVNKSKS